MIKMDAKKLTRSRLTEKIKAEVEGKEEWKLMLRKKIAR